MPSAKRRTLIYFLNIKYEELFNRYISGNINFPIIENGTVRISEYITLEKEKEIKEREWRNIEDFKNNEELLQKRLKKFGVKSIPHPKKRKDYEDTYQKEKYIQQKKEEKNKIKNERKLSFSSSKIGFPLIIL